MEKTVSLCMIVKNEEKDSPRCLESVRDIVDEMIIVDTGSSDRTVEIAQSYGGKVFYYKWNNDFSAARNESLKHASCDWILIMDADDEFNSEDKQRFLDIVNSSTDEVYLFETHSFIGTHPRANVCINLNIRLIKNNEGYYYSSKVHEQLINKKHDRNPSMPMISKTEDIKIYHYGYLENTMREKNKRDRNKNIIKKQIEEEPNNGFHYFNMGSEYFAEVNYEEALKCFMYNYKNFNSKDRYSHLMLVRMIFCYFYLKNNDEAIKIADLGMKYYPEFTDLYYLKGMIYKEEKRYTLAIKNFNKCIEIGIPPVEFKFIVGVEDFFSYVSLLDIYIKLKDYDEAYKYAVKCLQIKPDYIVPLYNIAHIFKEQGIPIDELKPKMEKFFC